MKNLEKTLPHNVVHLLRGAANAIHAALGKTPSKDKNQWLEVHGCHIGKEPELSDRNEVLQVKIASVEGAKPATGWIVEDIRRKGVDKFVIVMQAHTIMKMADGSYMCALTPAGNTIKFLPMELDMISSIGFNRALYSSVEVKGKVNVLPAFKLCWAANCGDEMIYSTDIKHSRYLSWGFGDPYKFMQDQGLDPLNKKNAFLCSDLDEISFAWMVKPHPMEMDEAQFSVYMASLQRMQNQGKFNNPSQEAVEDASVKEPQTT